MTLIDKFQEERHDLQQRLHDNERTVSASLRLANETIEMVAYMSEFIKEPFMLPVRILL